MKEQNNTDLQIRRALHNEAMTICATAQMKDTIDEQIQCCEKRYNIEQINWNNSEEIQWDDTMQDQWDDTEQNHWDNTEQKVVDITKNDIHRKEEKTMRRISKMRIAVAAVAAFILIPTCVYAVGQITGYASSVSMGHNYASYEEIDKAREDIGYAFRSVESFSNGYTIDKMDISGVDKLDDKMNRVETFDEYWGTYKKDGCDKITLIIHEELPEAANEASRAMEQTEIDGITVEYLVDHYKNVPVDYEITAEDEANMEGEHYYISVGSDEVEEEDVMFTNWVQDGIYYSLMYSGTDLSSEDFFQMATELIQQ